MLPLGGFADNIRGPLKGSLSGQPQGDASPLFLGLEDLVELNLTPDSFTQGFLMSIKIPSTYHRYENSFVIYFYDKVYPKPTLSNRYYTGDQAFREILPMKEEVTFYLPLPGREENPVESDFRIPLSAPEERSPYLITLLPLMKGLPEEAVSLKAGVTLSRIIRNKGAVKINYGKIREEYRDSLTLEMEGTTYYSPDNPIILEAEEHVLKITSPYHEDMVYEFRVKSGEILELPLELTEKDPVITFDIPEGTQIIVDGEKLNQDLTMEIPFSQGDHSFFFTLGDHQVTRNIYLQGGKNYKISIFLDILIEEAKNP